MVRRSRINRKKSIRKSIRKSSRISNREKKISVFLQGGLGNQLFQIFTTINYSLNNKTDFIFEYSDKLEIGEPRPTYWKNFLKSLKPYTTKSNLNYDIYEERDFTYHKIPTFKENTMLEGFFQSYKYFNDQYQNIIKLINIKQQKSLIKKKYKIYNKTNTISIHFRLGDYVKLQDYHPIMNIDYYIKSLKYIVNDTKKYNILYFCQSKDNEVVLKNIEILKNIYNNCDFIKVSDKISDWEQLLLMSNCKHNIIANSSFSWWGAYFNDNKNKIVCYPSIWFGKKLKNNTKDLLPKDWIKITNKKSKR